MATNKVIYNGNTLIDLSTDTLISPDQLLKGVIAHAKDGRVIVGTYEAAATVYTWKKYSALTAYTWKKYNAVATTGDYIIYATGWDTDLDTLIEDIDNGDCYPEDDCDTIVEPSYSGKYGGTFYYSISVNSSGTIVGSRASSSPDNYYYANSTWYYVGDRDSNGDLYLFELEAQADITYSQGTYIEDVTSTSQYAYTSNGVDDDGYWYVKQSGTSTVQGVYIEDVTSTNSTAYPSNGVQDGYWYVKQ